MTPTVPQPAMIPSAQHLALVATLAVHPALTTRAKTLERLKAADMALQYLRLLLRHVSPVTSIFGDAFVFVGHGKSSGRRNPARRRTAGEGTSPITDYTEMIGSVLAATGSLWARTDDFWQVVGWSFNCSIIHKNRWERWSAWLEFMIDLFEIDWNVRKDEAEIRELQNSLIMTYITSGGTAAGNEKRILRAVFADGRPKCVSEFGEIWENEAKRLKKDSALKKAEAKIDIEADNYGDYMEDEEDVGSEEYDTEMLSLNADQNSQLHDSLSDVGESLGGMDSIRLRIRLLSLLSKASDAFPELFTPVNTLYQTFFEHIRPLPIPAFFAIMSPSGIRFLEPTAASTLTQYILRSTITSAAPLPSNDDISQDILERCYLPFPANTNSMIHNTKVSLCVETLLRLLDRQFGLEWTSELHQLTETGINSRIAKAKPTKAKNKRAKKGIDENDDCDRTWLISSSERIRMVVEMARP